MHIVNYQNSFKYWPPKGREKGISLRFICALYPDRKCMPHPACRSVIKMNQKKAEAAHVWHCGSSSPPATRTTIFSSANNERNSECLHLCDRLIVIACQSVALCVFFFLQIWGSGRLLFPFSMVFCCLATVFMPQSSSLLMGMAQHSPHICISSLVKPLWLVD